MPQKHPEPPPWVIKLKSPQPAVKSLGITASQSVLPLIVVKKKQKDDPCTKILPHMSLGKSKNGSENILEKIQKFEFQN